jgi:PAS domain S-box-containing protein
MGVLNSVDDKFLFQIFINRIAEKNAHLGTYAADIHQKLFYISENLLKLLGIQPGKEPLALDVLTRHVATEDAARIRHARKDIWQNAPVQSWDYKVLFPDQSVKYLRESAEILDIGDEQVLVGYIQDITKDTLLHEKLTNSHAALRKSEISHLQMISEIEDYAIILLNKDGIIENWNKGAEKIKGYSEEEILGKPFTVFYTEEDRSRQIPQQLLETARTQGRVIHEGWRVRKDHSRFWGLVVITAIHDQDGQVIGFTKVTRDLTSQQQIKEDQVRYQNSIEAKNTELEKINKDLSSFNHMVSHDLQEPLRKILIILSRIRQDTTSHLSEKSIEYFDRIQKSSERMQLLIQDLITYSLSRINIPIENVDLQLLLNGISNEFASRLQEAGAILQIGKMPVIKGYPTQLEQLFTNLIENSIKYRHHEKPLWIDISHEVTTSVPGATEFSLLTNQYHHIVVADNGIGFENQYAEAIFKLFYRLHTKDEYSGTGMGLAICQRIMENHQGLIRATGQPGTGARFHLYFPIS